MKMKSMLAVYATSPCPSQLCMPHHHPLAATCTTLLCPSLLALLPLHDVTTTITTATLWHYVIAVVLAARPLAMVCRAHVEHFCTY